MTFEQMLHDFAQLVTDESFIQATISQKRRKSDDLERVRLKPILLKGERVIQFEYQYTRIMQHKNLPLEDVMQALEPLVEAFRQIHAETTEQKVHIQISKKFKVRWQTEEQQKKKTVDLSHNRKKQYILEEGTPYPFLVRLGVQTPDGKVKAAKYDKFKQINRFVELIEDTIPHLPKDKTLHIIDFGSGKSYLTFALYYYLKEMRQLDIRITGLDLKKEVIEHCSLIARDLPYDDLSFEYGDISDYTGTDDIDMVVTLHACDVATDLALARAAKWNARVILSVPCCQHELFNQMDAPHLEIMTKHGLIKERFAALATDSMRAALLELIGYDTQLLEFIDMEHTAKNILIRAYRTNKRATKKEYEMYQQFRDSLQAKPFLERELRKFHLLPWHEE